MASCRSALVLCVGLLLASVTCKPNEKKDSHSKHILVFGGNGFIGSASVEEFLKLGHTLALVNRGNWYWDSSSRIKPYVRNIICDRGIPLDRCDPLVTYLETLNYSLDAVVDFSAYQPFAVTESARLLRNKTELYIYISSDSVYEVCLKNHSDPSKESDAVRSTLADERQELSTKDDYGHNKLLCEEELMKQRANGGIPFVFLRLPDVVGPRDNTYRWWIYQMWLRLLDHLEKPVSVPQRLLGQPMSLVYSKDVANAIILCLNKSKEIEDQSFNIASVVVPSLLDVINDMKVELNLTQIPIRTDTGSEPLYLFPSVRLGPISTEKAKEVLGWRPTPWQTIVRETVQFYEAAITNPVFESARKDIVRMMQTYFTSRPIKVLVGLKKIYDVSYDSLSQSRDEL